MFIINFKYHTGLQSWQRSQVLWETSLFHGQNGCVPQQRILSTYGVMYLWALPFRFEGNKVLMIKCY